MSSGVAKGWKRSHSRARRIRMPHDRDIKIVFAFLVICAFFLMCHEVAFSGMSGTETHQLYADHMQHMHTPSQDDATVDLKTEPADITAGSPVSILLSLKDHEGRPMQGLTVHHDRLLHVVIVSEDFSIFAHLHPEDFGPVTPEMKKTARFPLRYTFPKAGSYLLGVDFAAGERSFSRHFSVSVSGEPKMAPLKKDISKEERFDDLDVTFSTAPKHPAAGEEMTLGYLFKNEGRPVTDLEPYLSAPMHLAIISTDLNYFLHTHGELPGASASGDHGHDMHMGHEMHMTVPERFGPNIEVRTRFPAKGLYEVFGEVRHQGKVVVTKFLVEVE